MLKKEKQKEIKWITNETPSSLQVMIKVEGEPTKSFIFHTSNKAINKLRDAIERKDINRFMSARDVYSSVRKDPNFQFKEDHHALYFNGVEVPEPLAKKIFAFHREGFDTTPLVRFAERLAKNPSYVSVARLYECLNVNHHPILEDGRFLAYKRVGPDFKDLHSGTIDNSVGAKPTVPRNKVDDDSDKTCSYGLHVASFEYAASFYGRSSENPLLVVAVDPADVVAVPPDYNQQKMRVCSYEVLRVAEDQEEIRAELVNDYGFELEAQEYKEEGFEDEEEEFEDEEEGFEEEEEEEDQDKEDKNPESK